MLQFVRSLNRYHVSENYIRVNNSCFDTEDNEWRGSIGDAVPEDPTVGSLLVSFPESRPFNWLFFNEPNYHIVFLKNYEQALVYSCSNYLGFFGVQSAWFLSRRPEIDESDMDQLVGLVEELGIDSSKMIETSHGKCPPMQPWWEVRGKYDGGHERENKADNLDEGNHGVDHEDHVGDNDADDHEDLDGDHYGDDHEVPESDNDADDQEDLNGDHEDHVGDNDADDHEDLDGDHYGDDHEVPESDNDADDHEDHNGDHHGDDHEDHEGDHDGDGHNDHKGRK